MKVLIQTRALWQSQIDHPVSAEVLIDPLNGNNWRLLSWSDGYSDYHETPDNIYQAIEDEVLCFCLDHKIPCSAG